MFLIMIISMIIGLSLSFFLARRYDMSEKVDKGIEVCYWKLSYRRKLIRTLWMIPVWIMINIVIYPMCRKTPCFSYGDIRHFHRIYASNLRWNKNTLVLDFEMVYNTHMNIAYKSNNNIVYSCKYHVVWCPKYRRKILTNGIDTRLKELLLEYAANISVDIMEMEIMPDHVHILMEVDPQFGIHKAVKSLKGYTSKVLRNEYPSLKTRMPSLWTNSYFVSTVGGAPLDVIKQYIENQKTSQRQKDKLG